MSHYRDLNKELVEQVQAMRKNMKLYCDEIVYLKGELMQKHESEVILRKQCYNWAVSSFVQLIQSVQPDSEILPVLEEHINSAERLSSNSTGRRRVCPTIASVNRRRSSLITQELQRSNSVINLRKSVCSTSPIRRSSNEASDDAEDEEQNLQASPGDNDEEENLEAADNHTTQKEIPRTTDMEHIIYEESDEEEEEIYNCEDNDIESVYESIEELSINISEKRTTRLNDITNILKTTSITSKEHKSQDKSVNKRVQTKRTRKRNVKGKENFSDEYTTSKEDSDMDIKKVQNDLRERSFKEKSNQLSEEETLQEPRRYSINRRNFDTSKSFPLNHNHDQISSNEATLNSTSLVLNDMTLKNFKDIGACSTPNSQKNSLEATSTIKTETISIIQTSSNTSSRPSRNCKPTNLTEPQLKHKLRSEPQAKRSYTTSRKVKSKPKSKK